MGDTMVARGLGGRSLRLLVVVLAIAALLLGTVRGATAAAAGLVSDDFSTGLDSSTWTVVDPLGDGTVTTSGQGTSDATLDLTVPAGTSHNPWDDNRALRVMQPVSNGDFEVEAKFASVPTQKFQMQGLMVAQDDDDWLRFELYHSGSGLVAFAAATTAGSSKTKLTAAAAATGDVWMRVRRVGTTWTLSWSDNGTSWVTAGSFTSSLVPSSVGPHAANHAPNPAFTAIVDYVFDTSAPIVPEDPAVATHTLVTNTAGQGSITTDPAGPDR